MSSTVLPHLCSTVGRARQRQVGCRRQVRVAPPAGLEPATSGLEIRRSLRLSYGGAARGSLLPVAAMRKRTLGRPRDEAAACLVSRCACPSADPGGRGALELLALGQGLNGDTQGEADVDRRAASAAGGLRTRCMVARTGRALSPSISSARAARVAAFASALSSLPDRCADGNPSRPSGLRWHSAWSDPDRISESSEPMGSADVAGRGTLLDHRLRGAQPFVAS